MKLHYSELSPYARKVRIVVLEKGLGRRVETVATDPYGAAAGTLRALNPLGKVPTLVLDNGSALYDSDVICDYLDALDADVPDGPRLLPGGDERLVVRRRLALTDGILDAAFNVACERNRRPENERSSDWIARWGETIGRGVAALADEVDAFGETLTLAHVGAVCALDYVALRAPDLLDWRDAHPALVGWYGRYGEREAMRETRPGR